MTAFFSFMTPFFVYLVGTLSPGPANLAIIKKSLEEGRLYGIVFSLGVITGSLFWGVLTVLGLGQLVIQAPGALRMVSIIGGAYMAWLAYSNIRKFFLHGKNLSSMASATQQTSWVTTYSQGLFIHLTNPKAILTWMTIVLMALDKNKTFIISPHLVLVGCFAIGIFVFCGYAFIFSNQKIVMRYHRVRREINLAVGCFFAFVSLRLIFGV